MITIVNALKLYDENSVKGQELLNATLNKAVSDNNAAIAKLNQIASDLDARDKNIISNVGEPLTKQLDEMGQRISGDLRNLTKAIDRIDDPLSKTAGDIQRMFKNILGFFLICLENDLEYLHLKLLEENKWNRKIKALILMLILMYSPEKFAFSVNQDISLVMLDLHY